MYVFRTPTVSEAQQDTGPLLSRYTLDRGVSVLRFGSDYVQRRYPSLDELRDADQHYLGGHQYVVSEAEKDQLEAAGFAVLFIPGYGELPYGSGPYGGETL